MRIALISDIHGNTVALDAVLDDIHHIGGVTSYWLLGDLFAMGPDPAGVLERINALPNMVAIRGNTERWLLDVQKELPLTPAELSSGAKANESDPLELAYAMVWTHGALATSGCLSWVAELPLDYRTELPDGTRVLCVHAAPGEDDGDGIRPMMSDGEIEALINDADADLIIVGHTHWALDRTINGTRIINLGSVSLPVLPDLRASYALLEADQTGYTITFRKVDYDHAKVVDQLHRQNNPAYTTIAGFLQGKRRPFWEE